MEWKEHSDDSLIGYAASHLQHSGPAAMEMQRRLLVAIKDFNAGSSRQSATMIRLTWAIAALTVVLAVIASVQLWAMLRPASGTVLTSTTVADQHAPVDPDGARRESQDLLLKKVQCQNYEQRLRKEASESVSGGLGMEVFYSVFYSGAKNSCLYAYYTLYQGKAGKDQGEILQVRDVLTSQTVWFQEFKPSRSAGEVAAELNKAILQFQ